MTDEKITIGELGAYTNNSMNREGLKKLVDKVNNGGSSGDAYTKAETDALLAEKADADDVYTKTEVDTELSEKADADDVYTKTEVDTELADKQDVLTAGSGISISAENVISATGGSDSWTFIKDATYNDLVSLLDIVNNDIIPKKDIIITAGDFWGGGNNIAFYLCKGAKIKNSEVMLRPIYVLSPTNKLNTTQAKIYIKSGAISFATRGVSYDFTIDNTSVAINSTVNSWNDMTSGGLYLDIYYKN